MTKVEFKSKKLFSSTNIDALDGHFAVEATPIKWENCRERFAKAFTASLEGFFFKHPAGRSISVASFIVKTEDILKEPLFSSFSETNRDTILWVEPSEFWKSCQMRRSLLTILLRCGMLYDLERDNYEEALFTQEYVIPTKKAMMRFLFGFTKYVGPNLDVDSTIQVRGWKSVFEGKDEAEIKSMLVHPGQNPYTPSTDFERRLWC